VDRVYRRLLDAGPALLATAATYLEHGRSLEETARILFVHPNTVRYRLRRVGEVTGLRPADGRDGYVLHVAISAGRLAESSNRPSTAGDGLEETSTFTPPGSSLPPTAPGGPAGESG
jgi:hypothetical protein